jgi:hypothetical protein
MTIVNFLSGSPGPTGPTGPVSEQYQNSLAMLAWLTGEGRVNGFDFESYNFVTKDGIDPSSVLEYNSSGYVEAPVADTNRYVTLNFDDSSKISAKDYRGIIFRWYQDSSDSGHFEGVTKTLGASAAVDKGSGKVGLPCSSHGYSTGTSISVRGTVNYNAIYTVDATSSTDEIVVTASYVSETFTGAETVNQRVTLGSGKDNTYIEKGLCVKFLSGNYNIRNITNYGDGASEVQLSGQKATEPIVSICRSEVRDGSLYPALYQANDYSWTVLNSDQPQARQGARMVWDSTNKVFWIYGGTYANISAYKSDLWKFDPASKVWTQMSPTGGPPSARYNYSMIFDPVNTTLILFGGVNSSATRLNELWKYTVGTNTWSQLSPTGGPPTARSEHTAVYDSVNATMLVYGGTTGSVSNELWKYTISTNTWSQITFSGSITARRAHTAIYEGGSIQLMWIYAGYTTAAVAEMWKYDVVANSFTQVTMTGAPSTRYAHGSCYVASTRTMYTFGKYSATNEFYSYNLGTNTWTTPSVSGAAPDGRHGQGMETNPDNGQFYMFGGYVASGLSNGNIEFCDFWTYNPSNNSWTQIGPLPRTLGLCIYAPQQQTLLCGYGYSDDSSRYIKDMWQYNTSSNQWSQSYASVAVETRASTQACYDSDLDAVWCFGGDTSGGRQDLWRLNLSTLTWTYFSPNGALPASRSGGVMVYDSNNQHLILITGSGPANNAYNTIYKYIKSTNTWVRMLYNNPHTFLERYYVSGAYDPVTRCVYLYGGTTTLNETWKYDIENNNLYLIYPTGTGPGGRHAMGAFFREADRSIYLFGGYGVGSVRYNDFYRYSIDENKFYQLSTTNTPDVVEFFPASQLGFDKVNDVAYFWSGRFTAAPANRSFVYKLTLTKTLSHTNYGTVVTSDTQSVPIKHWLSIKNVVPTQVSSGNSVIYHSVSFDEKSTFSILSLGSEVSLDASAAVNKGSGKVGLPSTSHGLSPSDNIRVYGTVNYNGNYVVDADTTTNEIVVVKTYVAETFTTSSKCRTVSWRSIVRDNSSTWQYKDSGGSWQNSSVNDVHSALDQAFGVSANRMTGTVLSAISSWEWSLSGGFQSGSSIALDFGTGLKSDSTSIPSLTSYQVNYSVSQSNLTWIGPTWLASANDPTKAYCVLEIEQIESLVMDTDLKAWVSIDDGVNYDQITGLTVFRQSGNMLQVKGTKSNVTARSNNKVKVKITSHNNKKVRLYKASIEVRA